MPITYKNVHGDLYYLNSKLTKKGNLKYYFSKKSEDRVEIDSLTEGYEVYENSNGQVFVRKKQKQIITDEEVKIVENGMQQYSILNDFKIDVKKNIIYIYTAEDDSDFRGVSVEQQKTYITEMRFILEDDIGREFTVERFNYRGSIDDWIFLDSSNNLEALVKEYVEHLGKDSFYELF